MSTTTNHVGAFTFDAVRGATTLRAAKTGFRDQTQRPVLSAAGGASVSFQLDSMVGQTYTLTFAASSQCNRDWWGPDFVPLRVYQAAFSQGRLYLSGASFVRDYYGLGAANTISFRILDGVATLYMEDPPLAEVDSTGRIVIEIYGHASGRLTDPVTELAFVGDFADCDATDHKLTLRRTGS